MMKTAVLIVLAIGAAACAIASSTTSTVATSVIHLAIIDGRGYPLLGVVVSDGSNQFIVAGAIRLTVTGPVVLIARKRGYTASKPQLFLPGNREIVLYELARAED